MKVRRFGGLSKYLTAVYWRVRLAVLLTGKPALNVVETVTVEMSEEEMARAAEAAPEIDTSDYIFG